MSELRKPTPPELAKRNTKKIITTKIDAILAGEQERRFRVEDESPVIVHIRRDQQKRLLQPRLQFHFVDIEELEPSSGQNGDEFFSVKQLVITTLFSSRRAEFVNGKNYFDSSQYEPPTEATEREALNVLKVLEGFSEEFEVNEYGRTAQEQQEDGQNATTLRNKLESLMALANIKGFYKEEEMDGLQKGNKSAFYKKGAMDFEIVRNSQTGACSVEVHNQADDYDEEDPNITILPANHYYVPSSTATDQRLTYARFLDRKSNRDGIIFSDFARHIVVKDTLSIRPLTKTEDIQKLLAVVLSLGEDYLLDPNYKA